MRIAFAAIGAAGASALAVVASSGRAAAEERSPSAVVTPLKEETPPGYFRDGRGKLLQTEFDMDRRVWFGGGWAPRWSQAEGAQPALGEVDFGARIDFPETKWRGRLHLAEGQVDVGRPWSMHLRVLGYDESRVAEDPVLRVTTFWPRPVRHDVYLSLGAWFDLLDVDVHGQQTNISVLRPVAAGATWDLWHGKDLRNTFRLRVGLAPDDYIDGAGKHDWRGTGIGHLELDAIADRAGFHHFTADAGADAPVDPSDPRHVHVNASGGLGYELIVLAVNDQPITLRVAGRGGYRDDLPGVKAGWNAEGDAGLRVNLWAPPPR